VKPSNWLGSLNCAVEGVLLAARSQRNMRAHILAGVLVVMLGWVVGATTAELAILVLAIGLVIASEVVNSSIEQVVDLLSPGFSEKARHAKDMAAGAVLVASFAAVFAGALIFYPHAQRAIVHGLARAAATPLPLAVATLGLSLAATVLLKVRFRRGTPLRGGMPSGHSAVAFAVWGLLSLLTRDPLVVLLVFLLAIMVSHSRMLMEIHSLAEVVVGALIGSSLALLVYRLLAAG
jgi:diacylglycerol kinase (ATP)